MTLRNLVTPFRAAEIDYQDYQVLQWQAELPPLDLQRCNKEQPAQLGLAENTTLFLAAVLHARGHQLRNMIYRPVLYSSDRIRANMRHAQSAVQILKESVQLLILLNRTTTFVRDETLFFQDFLIAAFGGILLALCNAANEFSKQLGEEFFDVLDLCRDVQHKSENTFRTWTTVKRFEVIAPRLGLIRRTPAQVDSNSGNKESTTQSGDGTGVNPSEFNSIGDVAPVSSLGECSGHLVDTSSLAIDSWLQDDSYTTTFGFPAFGNEVNMLCDPNGDIARMLISCENF